MESRSSGNGWEARTSSGTRGAGGEFARTGNLARTSDRRRIWNPYRISQDPGGVTPDQTPGNLAIAAAIGGARATPWLAAVALAVQDERALGLERGPARAIELGLIHALRVIEPRALERVRTWDPGMIARHARRQFDRWRVAVAYARARGSRVVLSLDRVAGGVA